MIIRYFNFDRDWAWIKRRIRMLRVEDTCGFVAEKDGVQQGAIIFDSFLHNSAQGSIVIESPMVFRHKLIETALHWLYFAVGKEYLYVMIASNNKKALAFANRFGLVDKTVLKNAYAPGVDYLVKELHRDNYFIQSKEAA